MTQRSNDESRRQHSSHVRRQRINTRNVTRRLEAALSSAAFGRESAWHSRAQQVLDELQTALRQQREVAETPDGLLAQIASDEPRLAPRIEQLKREYSELERRLEALRADLLSTDASQTNHVVDVRQRIASLLNAIRRQRDKETELVFEAYDIDIGAGD